MLLGCQADMVWQEQERTGRESLLRGIAFIRRCYADLRHVLFNTFTKFPQIGAACGSQSSTVLRKYAFFNTTDSRSMKLFLTQMDVESLSNGETLPPLIEQKFSRKPALPVTSRIAWAVFTDRHCSSKAGFTQDNEGVL